MTPVDLTIDERPTSATTAGADLLKDGLAWPARTAERQTAAIWILARVE